MMKCSETSSDTHRPDDRTRAERLTVNLPAGTLAALKIHVAQREKTIREVVTDLIQNEIASKGVQA
ncbi:hypothetical protein [Rhizobium leguminosarum]|uniref:hypothetical protein n=1 Tax=Rhizobium TaxID=379 RepID=UPI00103B5FDB|nr:hypothetical protein [Rhizobium leguminosarum]TCA72258.1 hypothetical protein E0H69_18580 [Rhizobium leguminosarum bv. viciae]